MATLLIRDLPDEVHEQLILSARKARRSKEKQAMVLIERGLGRAGPDNMLEQMRKIREQCTRDVTMEEILAATEGPH